MEDTMDPSERSALIRKGRKLEEAHQAHVKRAAILLDAESRWRKSLSASDRRDRDYVLLALQSKKVPDQLKWGSFDRNFSNALRNDREIFMQRLELDEFETMYKDDEYKVPIAFCDDKELMLKIVSKCSGALSYASKELKNDRDVVMAAIQNPHSCAPKAIQYASKKLQGDRRIARALLEHGYGITAFPLLPRKLQDDYKLALLAIQCSSEECSESYEHLSELSEEMLDDYEIVYEAVKRRGSNLRFVTDEFLLEDIDIVMAACENDGAAIEYCPKGPTRDEILQGSNLVVLLENGGHSVLAELGDEYMLQSKYLMPAVKNGMVLTADFASKLYKEDRPLFMDVLRRTSQPFEQYGVLPEDIRSDATVGTAILKTNESFDEASWAFRFSKDIPEDVIRDHIDRLMTIAKNERVTGGGDIWDSKPIAVSLCKILGDNFTRVSTRLKTDVDVAKAAFSGLVFFHTIRNTPQALFRQNHDIAAMAIKALDAHHISWHTRSDIFRHFGHEVCSSRVVFMEWVRKGFPTRHHYGRTIPFANDGSVALEAIKNFQGGNVGEVFSEFSTRLRGNKAFMVSAVQANPEVLKFATEGLLTDFDYMLRGVSVSKEVLKPFSHKGREFDQLADFAAEVRDRLADADGYVIHFLGAIALDPSPGKRSKRRRTGRRTDNCCHLRMLDLGYETGAVIKRKIAEFAGIPVGPELKMLRAALENLQFWGY